MPLKILGQDIGRERAAAAELAATLEPCLRPSDNLVIVVGAKCYGQRRQDIDLLIFADFRPPLLVSTAPSVRPRDNAKTYLESFVLALEVKDHRPSDIRFTGNQVEVRYEGRWSNVSQAIFEQRFSVKGFLEARGRASPYILSGIWLRNVERKELPLASSDILVGRPTAADLWSLVALLGRGRATRRGVGTESRETISCGTAMVMESARSTADLFVREIQPTELDRRKLERICDRQLKETQYLELLGQQLLVFKGRGGAGKTIRLLQLAKIAHDATGARVLFLTYNKALAADVRRLVAIIGIRDKVDGPTIRVTSSDTFFWSLLKSFDLTPSIGPDSSFPEADYFVKKRELLQLLRSASPEEIRTDPSAARNPDTFFWDLVCIDEAQDWPEDERDIVVALFGSAHLVVADGVDQLVRQVTRCDWSSVAPKQRQIVTLRKSMRLKANLCRFVTAVAEELGVPWEMDVNPDIAGGRIKILRGDYTGALHETILVDHRRLGNLPIDFLFCVTGAEGSDSLGVRDRLISWGCKIWDGTSPKERSTFPTDTDQFRIVKYESSRGLEGWTVVCLDFDSFFEKQLLAGKGIERDMLQSQSEVAHAFASQWAMIPITRAVDTLVLQLQRDSVLTSAVIAAAEAHRDFVEIIG